METGRFLVPYPMEEICIKSPASFLSIQNCPFVSVMQPATMYGAQNEAYKGEREQKTPKAVYLQRVARVEAMRSAQNEMFT